MKHSPSAASRLVASAIGPPDGSRGGQRSHASPKQRKSLKSAIFRKRTGLHRFGRGAGKKRSTNIVSRSAPNMLAPLGRNNRVLDASRAAARKAHGGRYGKMMHLLSLKYGPEVEEWLLNYMNDVSSYSSIDIFAEVKFREMMQFSQDKTTFPTKAFFRTVIALDLLDILVAKQSESSYHQLFTFLKETLGRVIFENFVGIQRGDVRDMLGFRSTRTNSEVVRHVLASCLRMEKQLLTAASQPKIAALRRIISRWSKQQMSTATVMFRGTVFWLWRARASREQIMKGEASRDAIQRKIEERRHSMRSEYIARWHNELLRAKTQRLTVTELRLATETATDRGNNQTLLDVANITERNLMDFKFHQRGASNLEAEHKHFERVFENAAGGDEKGRGDYEFQMARLGVSACVMLQQLDSIKNEIFRRLVPFCEQLDSYPLHVDNAAAASMGVASPPTRKRSQKPGLLAPPPRRKVPSAANFPGINPSAESLLLSWANGKLIEAGHEGAELISDFSLNPKFAAALRGSLGITQSRGMRPPLPSEAFGWLFTMFLKDRKIEVEWIHRRSRSRAPSMARRASSMMSRRGSNMFGASMRSMRKFDAKLSLRNEKLFFSDPQFRTEMKRLFVLASTADAEATALEALDRAVFRLKTRLRQQGGSPAAAAKSSDEVTLAKFSSAFWRKCKSNMQNERSQAKFRRKMLGWIRRLHGRIASWSTSATGVESPEESSSEGSSSASDSSTFEEEHIEIPRFTDIKKNIGSFHSASSETKERFASASIDLHHKVGKAVDHLKQVYESQNFDLKDMDETKDVLYANAVRNATEACVSHQKEPGKMEGDEIDVQAGTLIPSALDAVEHLTDMARAHVARGLRPARYALAKLFTMYSRRLPGGSRAMNLLQLWWCLRDCKARVQSSDVADVYKTVLKNTRYSILRSAPTTRAPRRPGDADEGDRDDTSVLSSSTDADEDESDDSGSESGQDGKASGLGSGQVSEGPPLPNMAASNMQWNEQRRALLQGINFQQFIVVLCKVAVTGYQTHLEEHTVKFFSRFNSDDIHMLQPRNDFRIQYQRFWAAVTVEYKRLLRVLFNCYAQTPQNRNWLGQRAEVPTVSLKSLLAFALEARLLSKHLEPIQVENIFRAIAAEGFGLGRLEFQEAIFAMSYYVVRDPYLSVASRIVCLFEDHLFKTAAICAKLNKKSAIRRRSSTRRRRQSVNPAAIFLFRTREKIPDLNDGGGGQARGRRAKRRVSRLIRLPKTLKIDMGRPSRPNGLPGINV